MCTNFYNGRTQTVDMQKDAMYADRQAKRIGKNKDPWFNLHTLKNNQ